MHKIELFQQKIGTYFERCYKIKRKIRDKLKKKSNRFLKVREKSGEKIRGKKFGKKIGKKSGKKIRGKKIYPNDVTNFHSTKTNPLLVEDCNDPAI
jgi:hypothetical protein